MACLYTIILGSIIAISAGAAANSELKKSMLISKTSGDPPAVSARSTPKPISPVRAHVLSSRPDIPEFKPDIPQNFLHLESSDPLRVPRLAPHIMDGTEYGESPEHLGDPIDPHVPRSKHFLRRTDMDLGFGKERKQLHSTIDVDASESSSVSDITDDIGKGFAGVFQDLTDGYNYMVSGSLVDEADSWAQETRAGFVGYFDKLRSVLNRESKSVGKKLFEAADSYSHRFFNLVHVKESDHPALAAKVTRILVAIGLSLTLVFVIFAIALHLQRTLVTRAHEEAAKQVPLSAGSGENEPEQIFFAMPPPRYSQQTS